jgi:outer membrane biogenesis lipoprotein LolB
MRFLVAASVVLALAACSGGGEFDRVVSNPDDNYIFELAAQLDAAGIEFRARRDGSIAYRSRDEEAFKAVEERVKKIVAAGAQAKKSAK